MATRSILLTRGALVRRAFIGAGRISRRLAGCVAVILRAMKKGVGGLGCLVPALLGR